MHPPLKKLTDSSRYEKFIHSRDLALEKIFLKYQVALNHVVTVIEERAEEIAAHMSTQSFGPEHAKSNREQFERRLTPIFQQAIAQSVSLLKEMRRTVYVLSYAGQAEGIGRALGKETKINLTKHDIKDAISSETPSGGNPLPRVELAYHRLLRKVLDAFQLSQVLQSTPTETLERIKRAFPKAKRITKKAPVAKITESDKKPDDGEFHEYSFGTIDPDAWAAALQDYFGEYIPFGRSPYDTVFYPVEMQSIGAEIPEDLLEGYQWELEQELTEDFVQNIRDGEMDAANENNIDDYAWIAIVDSATDDCCYARDGLSSTEIQDKLDAGEDMGDCDAVVAPAHLRCRCRMAPMSSDMPKEEPPDFGSFNDWLDQKAGEA